MNSNSDQKSPTPGQWSTGLFGCFEDCGNCFLTACAPSVTFGHTAELLDEGRTSYINAAISFRRGSSLSLYKYRTKLRALYSLPEEPCEDFCVYCWCMGCAICQEYRELKNRGFDPSKGWDQFNASKMEGATASKMDSATTKPPSAATGMAR